MNANVTAMARRVPPTGRRDGGGEAVVPMNPNPFNRIAKATLETPVVLLYAAVIVTVLTVLYALVGG